MQTDSATDPVSKARKSTDTVVLVVTIFLFFGAIFFAGQSLVVVLYLVAAITAVSLLSIRMWQISLLGNSLRVQNSSNASLKSMVDRLAGDLKMPPVDVYITQDPYLNAYAIGFTRPFSIVINSAVIERLSDKELEAILIHELGHIKYKHTIIISYLQPLKYVVPVLAPFINWVFGFWSRRAELTCDRLALAYTQDVHSVANALIKVHVGANVAEFLGEEGVLYQQAKGRGVMTKMSQSLNTHPFLVTRNHELLNFANINGIKIPANVVSYYNSASSAQQQTQTTK